MTWIWWAPLAAAVLHIAEEFVFPGRFAEWDRMYRPTIRRSITRRFHIVINAGLLVLCLEVALTGLGGVQLGHVRVNSSVPQEFAPALWLALAALLFSNAIFHVVGTFRTRDISPGLWTGIFLYAPLFFYGFWYFLGSGQASLPVAIGSVLAGGSYHFWMAMIHVARARRATESNTRQPGDAT